jgi:outer membrane protein assembly factor BamB
LLLLLALIPAVASADDWPQWRGPNRDGVWRETGIIDRFSGPEIPLRWKAPLGAGYTGPTVAEGRVLVSDRVTDPLEQERVHCFDAETGQPLWTHAYDCKYEGFSFRAGPRASITIDEGRAYALGAMGHCHCLDAASGTVIWSRDLNADYGIRMPLWGIAAAPLVEGNKLILQIGGENGACVVALDKTTGKEIWRSLDDPASYSAPIVIDQAGRRVVVVQTGTRIVGLDAASGKVFWAHEIGYTRWVIAIATPVYDGGRILTSVVDKGAMMLKLGDDEPTAEVLWWRYGPDSEPTDGLHALMCTPLLQGNYLYGCNGWGVFRGLDARTGDRLWENTTLALQRKWGQLHIVRNADRVWLFNDQGELIIGRLSPAGFEEISRAKLIEPTREQLRRRDGVCWSHPAFANRHVFIRNDKELVCASLAKE